jgi:aspartyl-tRNA(Asn)/glutamyl-tRNA(Gln) amidotransferase subunit B
LTLSWGSISSPALSLSATRRPPISVMEYESVIGLEVHAQLLTDSKIFCGCVNAYGGSPNTQTCPVCLGLPGALPVLNRRAVEHALKLAIAVGGRVNRRSVFARKNYFYPDLPKGYQISQYESPLAEGGEIEIETDDGRRRIGIVRIHLEEDAGKSLHLDEEKSTLVDLNRCGVPLVEIVSAPDIHTPREAYSYLAKLRQTVQYLDICAGDMEKGHLRCDANVSVRPKGQRDLGVKTEVKNMNSFHGVERALNFEIERQIKMLRMGEKVEHETLLWEESTQTCRPMRSKEGAHDYRYFPEPDLMVLELEEGWVERVKESLPELPDQRKRRLIQQYHLREHDAEILTSERDLADYFESAAGDCPHYKKLSNWIMVELLRELKERKISIFNFRVKPGQLAEVLNLVASGAISEKMAKEVFARMSESGESAPEVIERDGLRQISDAGSLQSVVGQVLSENQDNLRKYYAGKDKLFEFFVGEVMKKTRGQANPELVNRLLREMLKKLQSEW